MRRRFRPIFILCALLFAATHVLPLRAADEGGEKKKDGRLGMFIRLRASAMQISNMGLGLAVRDEPGGALEGDVVDAEWGHEITPSIEVGFQLPNRRDRIQVLFEQFDQSETIGKTGPFQSNWVSRGAFISEDLDGDGTILGYDCTGGKIPGSDLPCEEDGQSEPNVLDGAEDLNFNGQLDNLRFDRSDALISELQTEILTVDVDYARPLKQTPRFYLDLTTGLRYAKVDQDIDVIYREFGSFAAYTDEQSDSFFIENGVAKGYDADGDGFNPEISGAICTRDCVGDGWGNGNGDGQTRDNLLNIPTVDETRIAAEIKTSGFGVSLGLRGEYVFLGKLADSRNPRDFQRSWAIESGFRFGLMFGDQKHSLRETLVDERDAHPNFINWDLNGDGVFGEGPLGHDFDCNGDGFVSAADWTVAGNCTNPNLDQWDFKNLSLTGAAAGLINSVNSTGEGYQDDPYLNGVLRIGDPIPESDRNTTIARVTKQVRDLSGKSSSENFYSLDVDLGVRWYFSRFADLAFGARASRWFDVGNVKNVTSDTSSAELGDGDLTLNGYFITLTVRPRF